MQLWGHGAFPQIRVMTFDDAIATGEIFRLWPMLISERRQKRHSSPGSENARMQSLGFGDTK